MSSSDRPDADPTRRQDPVDPDETQRLDHPGSDPRGPDRAGTAVGSDPTQDQAAAARRAEEEQAAAKAQRRRSVLMWLFGLVVGVVLTFLLVALTTDDPVTDAGAQERIDALEVELAERDAEVADLEARLAEAEAGAGDRDADVEQQREALDERAAALEEWEAALQEREEAVAQRERAADDAEAGDDAEADDGSELPQIDEETVDGIVDRILEQIRDLFS